MLLDRRKIRKWAKWIALGLAIVFAVSFVFIGVGQGGGGFNVSEIFSGGCSSDTGESVEAGNDELQQNLDAYAADPTDTVALLWLADYYESLFDASKGASTDSADSAAKYLEEAIKADPTLAAAYLDLGSLYIRLGDYAGAARILNEATTVSPEEPDVYLYLGRAQRALGKTGEAILAWQKYVELMPADSRQAAAVKQELDALMNPPTTTIAPSTTTSVAPTTTTAE